MCLGVPGRVVSVESCGNDECTDPSSLDLLRSGEVDFGGVRREVSLAWVPDAGPGDWVLVHVGFAIARIDAASAEDTLAWLEEADRLEDLADAGELRDDGKEAGP